MPSSHSDRWQRWWPWARRALTAFFFIALVALLTQRIGSINWTQVGHSLSLYRPPALIGAGLLAVLSYLLYASFDLIGRHYTHHGLGTRSVMRTALISYAFNLNLGALVGGIGFRYRLYSRSGLHRGTITRVLLLSMVSNWSGYGFLLGLSLLAGGVAPTHVDAWAVPALRIVGALLLLPAPAYIAWCTWSRRRTRVLRGLSIALPTGGVALLQVCLSMLNWATIAGIIWVLLGLDIAYPEVVAALLLAAVAGALTHVPAGLGVLEAVFLTLLAGTMAEAPLLAALLVYRALYYWLPLAIALPVYLSIEARLRPRAAAA